MGSKKAGSAGNLWIALLVFCISCTLLTPPSVKAWDQFLLYILIRCFELTAGQTFFLRG